MFKVSQVILIKSQQNGVKFLTPDVLKKFAPSYLEMPDFSRLIIQDIKIERVTSERIDAYSVLLSDDKLMDHVASIRNPDGDLCLTVLDPLSGYDLKTPSKVDKQISVQEVADDPMIDTEFHNNTLDTTSVLFVWAPNHADRTQAKNVSPNEEAEIILKHRRHAFVLDATEGIEIQLFNHTQDDTKGTGLIALAFEITMGMVESLAINDKTRRTPSV